MGNIFDITLGMSDSGLKGGDEMEHPWYQE